MEEKYLIYCLGYMVLVDDPPRQKLIAIVFFNGCILLEWEHCGTGSHEIFQIMWQLLLLISCFICEVSMLLSAHHYNSKGFILYTTAPNQQWLLFLYDFISWVKTREKKLYKKALFLSYAERLFNICHKQSILLKNSFSAVSASFAFNSLFHKNYA